MTLNYLAGAVRLHAVCLKLGTPRSTGIPSRLAEDFARSGERL
jgi:hypothetical protein